MIANIQVELKDQPSSQILLQLNTKLAEQFPNDYFKDFDIADYAQTFRDKNKWAVLDKLHFSLRQIACKTYKENIIKAMRDEVLLKKESQIESDRIFGQFADIVRYLHAGKKIDAEFKKFNDLSYSNEASD